MPEKATAIAAANIKNDFQGDDMRRGASAFTNSFPFIRSAVCASAIGCLALASTSTAVAQEQVRIAYSSNFTSGLTLYMSEVAPEIFAKHGVSVKLIDSRANSPNCIATVLSKNAEICSAGTTTGTAAIAEGANLQAIAVTQGLIMEIVLTKAAAAKTGTTATAPIEDRVRGLKGLTFVTAAPGTFNYVMFDDMLRSVGLSVADMRYRTLTDQVAMKEGLRNASFDLVVWAGGAFADLEKDGLTTSWIKFARGDLPQYSGIPFITVFADKDWIRANPKLVEKLHAGFVDANRALKADPKKYSALIKAKFYPDISDVIWDNAFAQGVAAVWESSAVTEQDWKFLMSRQETTSPGKNYSRVTFENALHPVAQRR
ncbi:MAG: ABC transporter substrate-binding protein [Reyranellaceae bacterium]